MQLHRSLQRSVIAVAREQAVRFEVLQCRSKHLFTFALNCLFISRREGGMCCEKNKVKKKSFCFIVILFAIF